MVTTTVEIRLITLLLITLVYAIYDVFNKRNVPNWFAYIALVIGVVVLIVTNNARDIVYGGLIALLIGSLSYLLYRSGFLGGGDFFEFVTIALILPVQATPLLGGIMQFNLPFILSVFIATGYVTVWAIPLYYLVFAKKTEPKKVGVDRGSLAAGLALLIAYVVLYLIIDYYLGFNATGFFLMLIIAVPSALILAYERLINFRMVSYIYPKDLEEGDIIAINLMTKRETQVFSKRAKHFERLATEIVMKEMSHIKRKLPVYRNSAPLAAFTFVGVVISLLVGNLLLYIVF